MLAIALNAYYDEVVVKVEDEVEGVVVEHVRGPYASEVIARRNTAVEAVSRLLEDIGVSVGVSLSIYKGIPVGRGLGSSGATAAAAVIGVSRLLGLKLSASKLVGYAGQGEKVSAGSPHYDNVAASLMGGLVVVSSDARGELRVISVPFKGYFALVTPMNPVPEGKTGVMRKVLPSHIALEEAVRNFSRAAAMIAAAVKGDLELFGVLMSSDEVVEPKRAPYVPCYEEVRKAAFEAGALGFALSGAGPTMIALASGPKVANEVAVAMRDACECCQDPLAKVAEPAPGAEVIENG